MGASCDWSREAYTLDEARNRAVNAMFKMMHEDGIIERGYRIVNWDPQFQTTLSDDEVQTKEVRAKLLTFKYDADFPIAISTTRPETKFGDTAVAVHPDDARYKEYVGKTYEPVFCGKKLSIVIADAAVDPSFGTGALGVTPAHSMVDADMAIRHGLPMVQVIGEDGRMNEHAGPEFAGLVVAEARAKIESALSSAGLLQGVEEVAQNLPVAERGGAPVEQLPKEQWFVRVNKPFALRQDTLGKWKKGDRATLKELMHEAVASGQTRIVPEQFSKIYFHWIDNLRDWCISRQIWFGHRVPVWYHEEKCIPRRGHEADVSKCLKMIISAQEPTCEFCDAKFTQDPDTLDTWFSSGMWTFSTLGWPDVAAADLKAFHPTDVLETGRDIIFFWVARMVLMSVYALGEVPFRTAYLHGLVLDEQGRKMSKSLANIIDPRDVATTFGTDAVRLSLVIGTSPGADTRLGEEKIGYFRNFTNKLWNISRFVLMNVSADDLDASAARPEPQTLADRWILSRLAAVTAAVTEDLDTYNFSRAGDALRDFTWNELADWYLEIAKVEGGKGEILAHLLRNVLTLWHPFMPFVTEEVWRQAFALGERDFLMVAPWPGPSSDPAAPADADDFDAIREVITAIRTVRAEYKVEPGKKVDAVVAAGGRAALLETNAAIIRALARIDDLTVGADAAQPMQSVATIAAGMSVYVPLAGLVDVVKERARLEAEIEAAKKYAEVQVVKLENQDFVSRAPAHVIDGERAKLAEAQRNVATLQEQLKALGE